MWSIKRRSRRESERVEFSPLTLCDTATEFETDLEIERSHSFKSDANLKQRVEEKIFKIKRNQNGNEETDNISDKNGEYRKDKKRSAHNSQKNEKRNITEKTDKKKILCWLIKLVRAKKILL